MAEEHGLPTTTADGFARLLEALASEPDPHTTVADPRQAVDIHIRDSLSALHVEAVRMAESIVDIGAGPGFPGLPLAIALPSARVDLVETASRKCAVIDRLIAAAGVDNARSIHARIEDWARLDGAAAYDVATARAVASLAVLVEYAAPLLVLGGTLLAWKGAVSADERQAGIAASRVVGLEPLGELRVSPYDAARALSLHLYSKVRETPARYPRKPGIAAKRPLGAETSPGPALT